VKQRTRELLSLLLIAIFSVFAIATSKRGEDKAGETSKREEVAPEASEPDEAAEGAETDGEESAAEGSEIGVTPLQHGSLVLTWKEWVIAVDPVQSALDAAGEVPKADLVLVTHSHPDHLDPDAIRKLRTDNTAVVMPSEAAKTVDERIPLTIVASNEYRGTFLEGNVTIEAVPMYNQKRKRENGEFYHPKGNGNGYVIEIGDQRVYVSGDTECTPEMKALEDIDLAFVCMNLPYTMTVEESAECIREFEPKRLYPYHYRGQDPSKLEALLKDEESVELVLLDWYPGGGD
jgi:L-ascorbate metabolism protein UlaG (beta-lactamase superfamily)